VAAKPCYDWVSLVMLQGWRPVGDRPGRRSDLSDGKPMSRRERQLPRLAV